MERVYTISIPNGLDDELAALYAVRFILRGIPRSSVGRILAYCTDANALWFMELNAEVEPSGGGR